MKRLILAVVAGLLCLIPVTTLAQRLTFIQGSDNTRSIRGKDVSGQPPSWNPITDPSPQGDGSYLVGDWESGNDKYIDVMAMQWNFPASLSQGAFVDSVRLTLLYGTSQSLKLSVKFFHADYEIWQHDRDDIFHDIVLHGASEILQKQGRPWLRINNDLNGTEGTFFYLPTMTQTRLAVYNVMGHEVAVVTQGEFSAGQHELAFNANSLPAGTYLLKLTADGQVVTRTMIVTK